LQWRHCAWTKKGCKLDIRKFLLTIKLALGLVLLVLIVRVLMLSQRLGEVFVPASASGTESVTAVGETENADAAVDYSVIVKRNIFGDANSPASATKFPSGGGADSDLQSAEEELGLVLVGTVSGSPVVSRAIIKDIKTQILQLYRMGQEVAGACVEKIEKDAVVLLHNGQRKTLTLKTSEKNDANQVPASHSRAAGQTSEVAKPDLPPDRPPQHTTVKIEQVESMLGKAAVEPYVVKGQVEGLKITGLEGISGAKDLGLKNGDIIRAVNGQQVTSKQKAFQIFRKTRSQPVVDIDLLRGDQPQKLLFVLR